VRADGGIDHVLSRKTAFAAAGAALATVPVAVAAAQDPSQPAPAPEGYVEAPPAAAPHGLEADGLTARSRANMLRDGAITQRAEHAHHRLVADHVQLAHKVARAGGQKLNPGRVDRVRTFTRPRLRAENRVLSRKLHKLQGANAGGSASPQLEAIAACESGGDPHSIGGGGAFRGKYQFTYGTWASVGGKGDPAAAPEAEQDKRAQMLLDKSGSSPWPVCGQ
jgi:Transglycosylase-like domain